MTPHNKIDLSTLTGQKYNRLTILEAWRKNKLIHVKVQCDCGKVKNILYLRAKQGRTKSCGCLRKEYLKAAKFSIRGI